MLLLTLTQATSSTSLTLIATVGSLAGYALATNKALATLPSTMAVIGTALSTIPASLLMKRVGRRVGFVVGALCATVGGLISAVAVARGYFLLLTAALGATFVGMQAFEWTKLIVHEGIRPWGNPLGAAQFGASFFMITGFHGTHVSFGVIFLIIIAIKVLRGDLDRMRPGFMTGRKGTYEIVETMGLYWHFVDLVWVFIFAVFYLW